MSKRYKLGPAILVTAAFIGPGTVMTASKAGAEFGFTVIWAVAFSAFSAMVLQSMAARLGIVSGHGISESLRSAFQNPFIRFGSTVLVLGAILFGNAAYQTGNILGAAKGVNLISPIATAITSPLIAIVALVLIWIGSFKVLQTTLTWMVAFMGAIFVLAAIQSQPDWSAIFPGLRPRIPTGAEWSVIGLIGTTVVPYNLFLHASASAQQYQDFDDKNVAIRHSQLDTFLAIGLGGFVTAALLITAADTFGGGVKIESTKQIAEQLRPTLGRYSEVAFAVGLFAAGMTSSLTAPIAAAFATAGCFGWSTDLADPKMKMVASAVIFFGLLFAVLFNGSPTEAIIVAQVANGMLLPIVAAFLLYTLNRSDLLGQYKNGWLGNGLGVLVLLVTVLMASRNFVGAWSKISAMFDAA